MAVLSDNLPCRHEWPSEWLRILDKVSLDLHIVSAEWAATASLRHSVLRVSGTWRRMLCVDVFLCSDMSQAPKLG